MNEVWNLNPIYTGFDSSQFRGEMDTLATLVKELSEFSETLTNVEPIDGLRRGIALLEALTDLAGKLGEYTSLRQSTDTRDSEAGSKMGQIMQVLGAAAGPQAVFQEWAAGLPDLLELVRGDDTLREYTFFFQNVNDVEQAVQLFVCQSC